MKKISNQCGHPTHHFWRYQTRRNPIRILSINDHKLKNLDFYPDLILFNAYDDMDIDFFSTVIVKYFTDALVLLIKSSFIKSIFFEIK